MSFMNTQMQFSLPSNMPNFNVANISNILRTTPILIQLFVQKIKGSRCFFFSIRFTESQKPMISFGNSGDCF